MDDRKDARVEGGPCLDVIDAIFTTRSMRRLRTDPIPDRVVWDVVDAAIRGPSSGNVQRWGWVVVSDDAVKAEIAGWYRDAWNSLGQGRREQFRRFASRMAAVPRRRRTDADPDTDPNRASGDYLANNLERAPLWIVVVQQGVRGEPGLVEGADVYGAVQNLMLAARKHGVGSTLTMLHRSRERDVAELLGLPDDAATVALIPLGYPMGSFSTPRRRPVDEVTHWGRWGHHRERDRSR